MSNRVLIDPDILSGIADAIREKTGESGTVAPSGMAAAVEGIEDALPIPPGYVIDEAKRLVAQVQSHRVTDGFSFLVCADVHADHTNAQSMESALHMAQGMAVAARYLSPDCIVHLGDLTAGAATTTVANGKKDIACVNRQLRDAFTYGGLPQLRTVGNHDPLSYSYAQNNEMLTAAELYARFGSFNAGAVFGAETNCSYCYRDFTGKKVRVILLDTSQQSPSALHSSVVAVSAAQYQFFADALAGVGSKTDAADWSVVILSHMPLDWVDHNGARILPLILKAYLDGSSGSSGGASYDYSGKNAARLIANFHGHVHCCKTDRLHYGSGGSVQQMDALKVAVPNACFGRNNEYGTTPSWNVVYGEAETYGKTASGPNDTAWCAVTVDLANGVIYADRCGAGYDRAISFDFSRTRFSVNTALTHAALSGALLVESGDPYSAVLTADSGYQIDTVGVAMGGVDITGTAYDPVTGAISIAAVTADLAITATASPVPACTNRVSASTDENGNTYNTTGYKTGYRLNSSGVETVQSESVVCGFIPYDGEVIRAAYLGGSTPNLGYTGNYLAFYDANRQFIRTVAGSNTASALSGRIWSLDPNDISNATIKADVLSAKYLRVSLGIYQSPASSFTVTLDEAI